MIEVSGVGHTGIRNAENMIIRQSAGAFSAFRTPNSAFVAICYLAPSRTE